jgi:aminoglycoside 6-adenylyltransferase
MSVIAAREMLKRIIEWGTSRDDIRGVVLLGSQARRERPADEWSDIDLAVFADGPDRYLTSSDWLAPLGRVLVTTVESSALGGGREHRALFASGLDVDFNFVPTAAAGALAAVADDPAVRSVLGRGFRVLVDKLNLTDVLEPFARLDTTPGSRLIDEATYTRLSREFWYHLIWAAKKLRRGEAWVAKTVSDRLNTDLVELIAWYTMLHHPDADTWHGGRFLEEWADPHLLGALGRAVAIYDQAHIADALRQQAALFEQLESDSCRLAGLAVAVPHTELAAQLEAILEPWSRRPKSSWPAG